MSLVGEQWLTIPSISATRWESSGYCVRVVEGNPYVYADDLGYHHEHWG